MSKKLTRQEIVDRINIPFDATINECWEWNGFINPNGYGMVQGEFAHRYIYRLFKSPIPRGLCVMHKCDNRLCVNPNHLCIGSRRANQIDMTLKGRQNTKCRLTNSQYKELVLMRKTGKSYRELAKHFNVSQDTCWKALTQPTIYNNYADIK